MTGLLLALADWLELADDDAPPELVERLGAALGLGYCARAADVAGALRDVARDDEL